MRISDWSSDVCSSDLLEPIERPERFLVRKLNREFLVAAADIEWLQAAGNYVNLRVRGHDYPLRITIAGIEAKLDPARFARIHRSYVANLRSEEHTSELQSLMRISYAVFCLQKKHIHLNSVIQHITTIFTTF